MEAGTGFVDDLATLCELTEESLLSELLLRYRRDDIYTYVGDILIAINPFKQLPIYGINYANMYNNAKIRAKTKPHIFGIADNTYQSLIRNKTSQCVVVSGESGAGKTESTKLIVRHIAYLCSGRAATSGKNLSEQLVEVNPLLEAFGNARTEMNNNSSRFGKYVELLFTDEGALTGGRVSIFLLEKSRVVRAAFNERNFHIFYYMLAGLSPEEKNSYFLKSPEHHRLLSIPGNSGSVFKDASDIDHNKQMYQNLRTIMKVVGFKQNDKDAVFALLAAVLHVCDIRFEHDTDTDGVYVVDEFPLEIVAQLLRVNAVELATVLISNITEVRGEKIVSFKTQHQANDGRDALAKALYSRLFSWIVHHVNGTIAQRGDHNDPAFSTIGLLDIAGFENFQCNSFEQLCINVANEQLQYYFNEHIFAWELEDLKKESISALSTTHYTSNEDILKLFVEKPLGLFCLLDEESKFPKATDATLLDKFRKHLASNSHFKKVKGRDQVFVVEHYAGCVTYHAAGFLEKNRDTLSTNLLECLTKSQSQVVFDLFSSQISVNGDLDVQNCEPKRFQRPPTAVNGSALHHAATRNVASLTRTAGKRLKEQVKAALNNAGTDYIPKNATAGSQFLSSLAALTKKLSAGEPHFVRCIKPNKDKRADFFVSALALQQLRYTGVMETVRIRREGYPTRLPFRTFVDRYKFISFPLSKDVAADSINCEVILIQAGITLWTTGRTKIFLKYWHTEQLNAVLDKQVRQVVMVQKHVRGFISRKKVHRLRQIVDARRSAMIKTFLELARDKSDAFHVFLSASANSDVAAKHRREMEAALLLEKQKAEERKRREEAEHKRKLEEERVLRLEEERKRRLEDERRQKAEEDRRRRAAEEEEDARQLAVQQRLRREEDERRQKLEAERWRRAEDEQRRNQDEEWQRKSRAHASLEQQRPVNGGRTPEERHPASQDGLRAKRQQPSRDAAYASPRSAAQQPVGLPAPDRAGALTPPGLAGLERCGSPRNVETWLAENAHHKTHVAELRNSLEAKAAAVAAGKDNKQPIGWTRGLPGRDSNGAQHKSARGLSASENDLSVLLTAAAGGRSWAASAAAVHSGRSSSSAAPASRADAVHFPHDAHRKATGSPTKSQEPLWWRSSLAAITGMDTIRESNPDFGEASHYARIQSVPGGTVAKKRDEIADEVILEVEQDVIGDCFNDKDCWCCLVYMEDQRHCARHSCRSGEVRVDGIRSQEPNDADHHVDLSCVRNPWREQRVAKLRGYVGKGLALQIDDGGNVWATRHGINDITVLSSETPTGNCFSADLILARGKLPHEAQVKVFDMSKFVHHVVMNIHDHGLKRLDHTRLKRLCVTSFALVSSSMPQCDGRALLTLQVLNLVALRVLRDEKALKEMERAMFKLVKMGVDLANISSVPEFKKLKLGHRLSSKFSKVKTTKGYTVQEKHYDPAELENEEPVYEDSLPAVVALQKAAKPAGHRWIKARSRKI